MKIVVSILSLILISCSVSKSKVSNSASSKQSNSTSNQLPNTANKNDKTTKFNEVKQPKFSGKKADELEKKGTFIPGKEVVIDSNNHVNGGLKGY